MNIVLIDDHAILVDSLKNLFISKNEFKSVKSYKSGLDFFEDKSAEIPDVVVLDMNMPSMNGINFTEKCKNLYGNQVSIIILSMINDSQTIKKMMQLGVSGYVSKASDFSELLSAIKFVVEGKSYISKDLKDLMINNMFIQEQVIYHLSPREIEVLKKVCKGQTIKEIAFDLKLSPTTIQYYHKCIMNKFKLKRTSDLIVFAIKNGFFIPSVDA